MQAGELGEFVARPRGGTRGVAYRAGVLCLARAERSRASSLAETAQDEFANAGLAGGAEEQRGERRSSEIEERLGLWCLLYRSLVQVALGTPIDRAGPIPVIPVTVTLSHCDIKELASMRTRSASLTIRTLSP